MKCSPNCCFRRCSKVQTNTVTILLKLCLEESWQADWNTSLDQADRWRSGLLEFIWIKRLVLQWRHFHGTVISHTIIHGALMFPLRNVESTQTWWGCRYSCSLYKMDMWSYFCLTVFGGKFFFFIT